MFPWVNREKGFELEKQGLVNRDFIPPFVSVQSTVPEMTPGCWQEWHSWGFGDGACFCFWCLFLLALVPCQQAESGGESQAGSPHHHSATDQTGLRTGSGEPSLASHSSASVSIHFSGHSGLQNRVQGIQAQTLLPVLPAGFFLCLTLSQVPASHRGSNEGEWCFHYCLLP